MAWPMLRLRAYLSLKMGPAVGERQKSEVVGLSNEPSETSEQEHYRGPLSFDGEI